MRSAVSSTMARTASTCGSSISCTPMNAGPTTFQWMCFRVSWRSMRVTSRRLQVIDDLDGVVLRHPGDGEVGGHGGSSCGSSCHDGIPEATGGRNVIEPTVVGGVGASERRAGSRRRYSCCNVARGAVSEGCQVARIADDRFRVFISHKHDDHAFADTVAAALCGLTGTIECFVSGADIGAGTDWNDEIRQALFRSHLLLLLFTNPSSNWDWCLYEAGLYTRFQEEHVCSVVSMFDPERSAPRPLSNLQGVPATPEKLEAFLTRLCRETWRVSDDWLRGPLARQVKSAQITAAAHKIAEAFPTEQPAGTVYHPCHRVVLDLSSARPAQDGIPEDARVVEGDGATTAYTLSLFRAATGTRAKTWGDLARLRRRRGCRVASPARPAVRGSPAGGALQPDHGDAAGLRPGAAPAPLLPADAVRGDVHPAVHR